MIDAIKVALECGCEARVYYGYDKKTDMYANCVSFRIDMGPITLMENLKKVCNRKVCEIWSRYPLTEITCK